MEGNVTNKEDTQRNQVALMFFTIAAVNHPELRKKSWGRVRP